MFSRFFIRAAFLAAASGFLFSPFAAFAADAISLADLSDKVQASVVRIDVEQGEKKGLGSGYVVGEDGIIATNYHVMAGATKATAVFKNGDEFEVKGTLHLDPKRDIAIVKIDKTGLTPLQLAEKLPRQAESVVAFGAPVGLSFSVSEGIVSAVRQGKELSDDDDPLPGTWIQTSAPISPGNSGGPLVSAADGKVVAMNTMVLLIGQNLNFAISSIDVAAALKSAQRRPVLALSQGAAKAKPNKRSSKSKNEIAAKDIPTTSLAAYVATGQKNFRTTLSDARKKLTEANETLRAMQKGNTGNALAIAAQSEGADFIIAPFRGQKFYSFPDVATKEKCIREQQKDVTKNDGLLKKLEDPKEGILNHLKTGGPELVMNKVGDVGFVAELQIGLITDDDEFTSYHGGIPVTVRGINTSKVAIGSKLEGRAMYVAGTESYATRFEGNKINIFVLREVPDETLLEHVKLPAATSGSKASLPAKAAAKTADTKKSAAPAPAASTTGDKDSQYRTWSDKSGTYKVEAEFVTTVGDIVVLKRRDNGKALNIEIAKLSQADHDFLKGKATKP